MFVADGWTFYPKNEKARYVVSYFDVWRLGLMTADGRRLMFCFFPFFDILFSLGGSSFCPALFIVLTFTRISYIFGVAWLWIFVCTAEISGASGTFSQVAFHYDLHI